jgi:pre-mRNA-processing factor 19
VLLRQQLHGLRQTYRSDSLSQSAHTRDIPLTCTTQNAGNRILIALPLFDLPYIVQAEFAKGLSGNRKKVVKAAQSRATPKDRLSAFAQWTSATPHSPTKPGITALDLSPSDPNLLLTGGVDGSVILFNHKHSKIAETLKAHKSKVSAVRFHPNADRAVAFSASADGTAVVWRADTGKFAAAHTVREHKGAITDLTVHPSGAYFITAAVDSAWAFVDAETGKLLLHCNRM